MASQPVEAGQQGTGVVVQGDLVLVDQHHEVRTDPGTGESFDVAVYVYVPRKDSAGASAGAGALSGTCSVTASEGTPRVESSPLRVQGYAYLRVSTGCSQGYSWSHKLFRFYGVNQVKQVGGTYNGYAGPGQTEDSIRTAACQSTAFHIYDNSHSWVGSPSQATLACYAP